MNKEFICSIVFTSIYWYKILRICWLMFCHETNFLFYKKNIVQLLSTMKLI